MTQPSGTATGWSACRHNMSPRSESVCRGLTGCLQKKRRTCFKARNVFALSVFFFGLCSYEIHSRQACRSGTLPKNEPLRDPSDSTTEKIYVTQSGSDGLGHQLLGMYSCMLLPLLDSRWIYVKKVFTKTTGHAESKLTEELFTALQRGEQERPADVSIRKVDNCWKDVQNLCKNRPKCNIAKQKLSERMRRSFEDFISTRDELQFKDEDSSIILHARGGDSYEKLRHGLEVNARIVQYIHETTGLTTLKISCEYQRDADALNNSFIPQLKLYASRVKWSFIIGGDPIQSWSRMTSSPALIPGASSFSLSAALLRDKPTFSSHERPIEGRYDDNFLPCSAELRNNTLAGETEVVYYDMGHGTNREDCAKFETR